MFNEEDYKQILQRRFKRSDAKFISSKIEPLSENVEGFMGDHYKMEVRYEVDGEQSVEYFFVKTSPRKNQIQKDMTSYMNLYVVEIFMYGFLFLEFEKYGFDTSFAPKCFYVIGDKTLVMEDLIRAGLVLPQRQKWYSVEECKCGLKSLAIFHAAGYMYEDIKSKELGRRFNLEEEYPKIFREKLFTHFMDLEKQYGPEWFASTIELCKIWIDSLPEPEKYKEKFRKLLDSVHLSKEFVGKTNIKKICTHGEFWSNNMLFKKKNGVAVHCTLVDFQLCRYFYPAFDVLLFIYSNTDAEFRIKYFMTMIEFYHQTLSETFTKHGYRVEDFYPKHDYQESLKISDFPAKLQAFGMHTLACLPVQALNEHVDERDNGLNDIFFTKRIPMCMEAFDSDKQYRNIVIEDIYDLFSILKKQ